MYGPRSQEPKPRKGLAIKKFFAAYPGFEYDPTRSPWKLFYLLAKREKWEPSKKKTIRYELANAIVQQFGEMYGQDKNSLESWQMLCSALGTTQAPRTIAACQQVGPSWYIYRDHSW